jgi:nicotinate-nucleotide adenylyltransferase
MRIGIVGGTFDPIHYGHLRLAEEAREAWPLDRLLFMPAGMSPFKVGHSTTPAEHRLAMLQAAVADRQDAEISSIEIDREGPSYMVDTLRALQAERPADQWVLIMGMDAFQGFPRWKGWREIVERCGLFVGRRAGEPAFDPQALFGIDAPEVICYHDSEDWFRFRSGSLLHIHPTPLLEISASELRRKVADGHSLRYLTPPSVIDYIVARALYGQTPAVGTQE